MSGATSQARRETRRRQCKDMKANFKEQENVLIIDDDMIEEEPPRMGTGSISNCSTSDGGSVVGDRRTGYIGLRESSEYEKIPEIPLYEATADELENPLILVKNALQKGYGKYGAIKLRCPDKLRRRCEFDFVEKKLTTRVQVLQNLYLGRCFEQRKERFTFTQYEKFAYDFEAAYKKKNPKKIPDKLLSDEYEFWSTVENPQYQETDVQVEYAADLPVKKYGSGFPTKNLTMRYDDPAISYYNLNNVYRAPNSLFQFLNKKTDEMSGVSTPWVYCGMLFASFCWHVEDMYMYSFNYMHRGATKTWYLVPEEAKEEFDRVFKDYHSQLFQKNPGLLTEITLMLHPLELIKHKIPVYRIRQNPGDFVITLPKVYHCGFSHGFNIGEAVNFTITDWVPHGLMALEDYTIMKMNKRPVFAIEWLIYENILQLDKLVFSESTKQEIRNLFTKVVQKELTNRAKVRKDRKFYVEEVFDDKTTKYSKYVCDNCQNYAFLTHVRCMRCDVIKCLSHYNTPCKCNDTQYFMGCRHNDATLTQISKGVIEEGKSGGL
eukprot:TRINITY_DN10392_c0_g2_i1.p1 TRINITY_DN10392_c0_g2~~TRINITY_DN10392_c0_g2_i1.p1  ORF type:complete len:548 (-),score=46.11 TRINITY_DN10392_c0_g2_i1:232-1875(-)